MSARADHRCAVFQAALVDFLRDRHGLPEEALEAARGCADCSALLTQLETASKPVPTQEPTPSLIAAALSSASATLQRMATVLRTVRLLSPLLLLALWVLAPDGPAVGVSGPATPQVSWSWLVFVLPLFAAQYAAAFERDRGALPSRLHARWEGHQVQGVCAGLGEYVGVNPWFFRAGFILLAFSGGHGFLMYGYLAMALSFHPDDRQHFLLFRVARGLRRVRKRLLGLWRPEARRQ